MFQRSLDAEGSLIPVVHDSSGRPIGIHSIILPEEFKPEFFSIVDAIAKARLSVRRINLINLELEEIELQTYNGPTFLFSLRFPASSTVAVIDALKNEPGLGSLTSVDLRVENRVYYK